MDTDPFGWPCTINPVVDDGIPPMLMELDNGNNVPVSEPLPSTPPLPGTVIVPERTTLRKMSFWLFRLPNIERGFAPPVCVAPRKMTRRSIPSRNLCPVSSK